MVSALAMSTIKERLGYRHEVVDRQLAHAQKNKQDAAYSRAKFLAERRVMMQDWADFLDGVASGKVIAGYLAEVIVRAIGPDDPYPNEAQLPRSAPSKL